MPRGKLRPTLAEVKALLAADQHLLRPLVEAVLQELLEAEMTAALGAAKGGRTAARLGYRSGYYGRTLVTRVGKLEFRVPPDRHGRCPVDNAARCPQGPTTATMIRFAEDSGHNSNKGRDPCLHRADQDQIEGRALGSRRI
jgi:Transposase, Mutator family